MTSPNYVCCYYLSAKTVDYVSDTNAYLFMLGLSFHYDGSEVESADFLAMFNCFDKDIG